MLSLDSVRALIVGRRGVLSQEHGVWQPVLVLQTTRQTPSVLALILSGRYGGADNR